MWPFSKKTPQTDYEAKYNELVKVVETCYSAVVKSNRMYYSSSYGVLYTDKILHAADRLTRLSELYRDVARKEQVLDHLNATNGAKIKQLEALLAQKQMKIDELTGYIDTMQTKYDRVNKLMEENNDGNE